nr:hypothetical protein WG33_0139 [uncultured bacterium]
MKGKVSKVKPRIGVMPTKREPPKKSTYKRQDKHQRPIDDEEAD